MWHNALFTRLMIFQHPHSLQAITSKSWASQTRHNGDSVTMGNLKNNAASILFFFFNSRQSPLKRRKQTRDWSYWQVTVYPEPYVSYSSVPKSSCLLQRPWQHITVPHCRVTTPSYLFSATLMFIILVHYVLSRALTVFKSTAEYSPR